MWDLRNASKALGKFSEQMNQERDTIKEVNLFTYKEFIEYTKSIMDTSYEVCKSTISAMKKSEMGGNVPANDYWVIRQVFLNESEAPVRFPDTKDSFYGRIVYAKEIDNEFTKFMGEKKMKTFRIVGGI